MEVAGMIHSPVWNYTFLWEAKQVKVFENFEIYK